MRAWIVLTSLVLTRLVLASPALAQFESGLRGGLTGGVSSGLTGGITSGLNGTLGSTTRGGLSRREFDRDLDSQLFGGLNNDESDSGGGGGGPINLQVGRPGPNDLTPFGLQGTVREPSDYSRIGRVGRNGSDMTYPGRERSIGDLTRDQ